MRLIGCLRGGVVQLEKLAATIRSRPGWEAIDLGFAMVRVWWWPLLRAWLVSAAPGVLLLTALLWEHPGWALLIVIWLKPLWSRVVLLVLSRSLFGTVPSARQVLLSLWEVWRFDLPRTLTFGRLDPTRSYKLPVRQLEGLRGMRAVKRTALLARRGAGIAGALALVCSLFETALITAAVVLVLKLAGATIINVFQPTEFFEVWSRPWVGRVCLLSYLPVMSLGETLFAAGGFALYLNRRVTLEGWDIELSFRRLAARLLTVAALWLGLPLTAALIWTNAPAALASESVVLTAEDSREAARAILKGPDLMRKEKVVRYLPKRSANKGDEQVRSSNDGWLANFIGMIARPIMWALGLIAIAAIVLAIIRSRSGPAFAIVDLSEVPPDILVGLDVRPESLPDDIPAAARALWQRGERIAALSLLYRASLVSLLHQRGVALAASFTEGDCLRAASAVLSPEAQRYLRQLTSAWQHAAYAQRAPGDDDGALLIDDFATHFSAGS